MQGEPGEPRGRWLQKEMGQYKKKHNFDENEPPTEEEIKMEQYKKKHNFDENEPP